MSLLIPVLSAPTGAGKTALVAALADPRRQDQPAIEIVSADAFTVYRGLDIGTAKPTPEERRAAPHNLIDVADVTEAYDVARYVREAEAALRAVLARGHLPVVVGGTGFYLRALIRGLPLTPPSDPAVRADLETELQQRGLDALLAEIAARHPAEAARMERNPRRVVRALEVYRQTGRFPGEFGTTAPAFRYQVTAFTRPWPELELRLDTRIRAMLRAGWPEEAQWLATQVSPDTEPRPTAWQALGYTEALAVARGTLEPEVAAAAIQRASRQYARRQLTFLRTQLGAQIGTLSEAQAELGMTLSRNQESLNIPSSTPPT
ncbi:tRNA (adenosine(37)-N6)-dimethylallyltransferase MiaA [Deinococcus hohokamensis]|uniref:tRNA dimethylallyltransferase n=1 Tax=Deinococcus hohokamensis TaxID=309883 RepID=A0ABV9I4R4_9DEIO